MPRRVMHCQRESLTRSIQRVLKMLETEGAKTLISLAVLSLGALLSACAIEVGKIVVAASLFILGLRLRPPKPGDEGFISAVLAVLGKHITKPPT